LLRALAITFFLFITGGFLNLSEAAGFTFKAGIGYDFLSQEYFLDSLDEAGSDSVYTDFALRTNYLDDLKGLFSVRWIPFEDRRLELGSSYEQTPDFFRLKFLSDLRTKIGASKFNFTGEIDWRNRHDDSAQFGDSYLRGYSRSKLSVPISRKLATIFQITGEFIDFDSVTALSWDYYRLGGKIGLESKFGDFSFGDIRLTVNTRQVPDSSSLNYLNLGLETSYFGFYRQGEIDFYTRLENKDYDGLDHEDDFLRYEFSGRHKLRLGQSYYLRQEVEFDYISFDPADPINRDYYQLGVTLLTGLEGISYSLGIGPDIELLDQQQDELLDEEDYFEAGLKIDFDLMKVGRFFVSAESVTGHRNLRNGSELLTDHSFERLYFIGDLTLMRMLRLNLLFSAEWEWHDISTNNSSLYLLSTNLSYTF